MATWRMSMRAGNHGFPMWPQCIQLGVAAITYRPLEKIDLSRNLKGEPKESWMKLAPAQKASLRRVAYEMKAGDVIYLKDGPSIVNKGIVKGPYQFDSKFRLMDPQGVAWAHQVPVEWSRDFPKTRILLGSEQLAVKELSPDKVKWLESKIDAITKSNNKEEALEGKTHKTEAIFRSRNRALIQAKKASSDYRCEVCGFRFEETYGMIGREFVVAHHLKLIAAGPSKTTLDDIALVCANCHAMLHTKNPPISIEDLHRLVMRYRKANVS